MEPVSFATALAGIPGAFVGCVECFKYIRLGQRFDADFGICLARLEAAQLRLTRWAEPIGLLNNRINLEAGSYKDADIITAYQWLIQIEKAFMEAREISQKYAMKQEKKGKKEDLVVMSEESDFQCKTLVMDMRVVAEERQKELSFGRKITWALYGKENFENLIDNLVTLITNLLDLFPTNKPRLQALCQQEVENFHKGSVLDLKEVLKNDDEQLNNTDDGMMSKLLDEHIEAHRLEFGDVKVGGSHTARFGDEYVYGSGVKPGNLRMDRVELMGSGYTHAGHVFYGKEGKKGMQNYEQTTKKTEDNREGLGDGDWDRMHGF